MMKLSYIVVLTVVVFALLFVGCDSTGAGGGGGGDGANDGTVTVSLSGATDLDGDSFAVYLYAHDEHSIHAADRLLAVNHTTVGADGTASFTLKVDDGAFEPSLTDWVGSGGSQYDLYIYTDSQDDGQGGADDSEPITSERAYRTTSYPQTVTIDGDQTVSVARDTMTAYTGGTVTVTLSNAAEHNGKWFYYGIFLSGAEPGADEAVAYAEKTIAEGSAAGTELRARFEEMDPWYAVDGTAYDLYAMIDMDGTGHSDGITDGDLLYQETFTQDGDRTIATSAENFEVYVE